MYRDRGRKKKKKKKRDTNARICEGAAADHVFDLCAPRGGVDLKATATDSNA